MYNQMLAVLKDDQGQGLAEYALILVLVSIAAVVTLGLLGTKISGIFTSITADL